MYRVPLLLVNFILAFHCFTLAEPPLKLTGPLQYAKTPYPLTRGYLKSIAGREKKAEVKPRRGRKPIPNHLKKKSVIKKRGRKRNKDENSSKLNKDENSNQLEKKYVCSICHKKHYKYRRNKLRHEKYECVTGPQFMCCVCLKKYSQKKTLTAHIALKHPGIVAKYVPED